MIRLRQYKPCDAKAIVSWIKDEEALRKWSSDRFGDFPITANVINEKCLYKTYLMKLYMCLRQNNKNRYFTGKEIL